MAEQATTVMLVNGQPNIKVYLKAFRAPVEGAATEHDKLVLKPGANRIDSALLKDPDFIKQMKEDIDLGRVYPMKQFDKLRQDEALALVELTGDADILNEWLKSCPHAAVQDAIRDQLRGITGLLN